MTKSTVAVVGCGVMGAATAWTLTQRGHDVVVFEQFPLGHDRGSSHGRARIFRLFYDDPRYVRMGLEALPLWKELEQATGEKLLLTNGGLDLGPEAAAHAKAMSSCGVAFETLDGREATRRFPKIDFPEGEILFEPAAATIDAERAVQAFASAARAAGAQLHTETPVVTIRQASGSVAVELRDDSLNVDAAVVTAGAWAKSLALGAGIALTVNPTRETVAYFALDDAASYPILVEFGTPSFYALPSPGNELKVGEHQSGPTTDPDEAGAVNHESVARVTEVVNRRFPYAAKLSHRAETCIYTNTSDDHFILERHERIVVGSPCSGHGFKFAPLIGRRLADLAEEALR